MSVEVCLDPLVQDPCVFEEHEVYCLMILRVLQRVLHFVHVYLFLYVYAGPYQPSYKHFLKIAAALFLISYRELYHMV